MVMGATPAQLRFALAGVALVVALGVGVAYYRAHASPATAEFYGNVDIREVSLGFRVAGRVDTLAVDEGDAVKEGQVLATLDADPLRRELNEAKANAHAIEARLALFRAGYRGEDIAQAQAVLAERRAGLTNAEQTLRRLSELKGTGAISSRTYDDAVAARDEARARVQQAEQSADQYQRGFRPQEIAEAEANLGRALAAVSQAELRLKDSSLAAPADGIVLTRAAERGAILNAGAVIYTLSLVRPVWVRAYCAEPELGSVNPGRSVLVYTDGRRDRPYHGKVGFVSPTAEFTPKNVETADLRTALMYRFRVVVSDPDEGLRQGMPVTVRIDRSAAATTAP